MEWFSLFLVDIFTRVLYHFCAFPPPSRLCSRSLRTRVSPSSKRVPSLKRASWTSNKRWVTAWRIYKLPNNWFWICLHSGACTGCEIRSFLRESNRSPIFHKWGIQKKFCGFMSFNSVLSPHLNGEIQTPKCTSVGSLLKKNEVYEPLTPTYFNVLNFLLQFQACDTLLAQRVEAKMKGRKVNDVINRLHLAMPAKRDNKVQWNLVMMQLFTPKYSQKTLREGKVWTVFSEYIVWFNSLSTGKCGSNFQNIILKTFIQNSELGTCCEIALWWMPHHFVL